MKYPDFPDLNVPDFLEDWFHALEYNCDNPSSSLTIGEHVITVFVRAEFSTEYPLYEIHLESVDGTGELHAIEDAENDADAIKIIDQFKARIERGE